jgi:hypothetical protein
LFIDNSSQERIMTCKRAAGYYIAHKRELNRANNAQTFGKIIHKGLEERYKSFGTYLGADATLAMTKIVTAEFDKWTPEGDDFRNYGTAMSAIKQYSDQYQLEDFEPYKFPDGKPFVELPFAQPLGTIEVNALLWVRNPDGTIEQRHVGHITIIQKGKIDLVYRREGYLYGMDHKTTSVMGPQYFQEFELASQVHCYTWAIKQLIGELPRGYTINGLGIRKPTKTGKSLEFIRHTVPIFPALVAEWETDTMQLVAEFVEGCRTNQLPKATKWCVAKYGSCEFRQVCGLEPHLREMSLYSNEYRPVTWDPLHE